MTLQPHVGQRTCSAAEVAGADAGSALGARLRLNIFEGSIEPLSPSREMAIAKAEGDRFSPPVTRVVEPLWNGGLCREGVASLSLLESLISKSVDEESGEGCRLRVSLPALLQLPLLKVDDTYVLSVAVEDVARWKGGDLSFEEM